jgi:hypothetical protein
LYGKTLATLRGSVSNRLLMYCAYVHCSYCLALVICVILPAVLCVPPVPAGRAIRCLAGRHPSMFTPFLPTVGPLVGPARLSLVTIMLPLSNPYPWFYSLMSTRLSSSLFLKRSTPLDGYARTQERLSTSSERPSVARLPACPPSTPTPASHR